MNCDAARRRLFADEHPERPSEGELRRHLAVCPACRAAVRRLAQAERRIPQLPVPPSTGRAPFLRRFERTLGPVVRRVPVAWPTPAKERGLRKLSLAVAIAAMLAFLTIALWSWPHLTPPPVRHEPPWVADIQKERDRIRLLPPHQQVEPFTTMVSDLRIRVRTLMEGDNTDELAILAGIYGDVLKKDLLPRAGDLSAEERPAALAEVAEELNRANSEFTRLEGMRRNSAAAEPLQQLALAAAEAGRDVQKLLRPA